MGFGPVWSRLDHKNQGCPAQKPADFENPAIEFPDLPIAVIMAFRRLARPPHQLVTRCRQGPRNAPKPARWGARRNRTFARPEQKKEKDTREARTKEKAIGFTAGFLIHNFLTDRKSPILGV